MPVGQDRTQHRSMDGAGHRAGPAPRAGCGNNHGWGRGAIASAVAAFLLGAGLLPAPLMPARPALAQATDQPWVQRDVPAEATAENAVVARDRALAAGQRLAYERMAVAMGLPRSLPDAQIEAQVASLVIESERITPRGYSARITVNFRPPGGGGAFALPQAPAAAGQRPGGPAVATVEAVASYRSLAEYVEITRRLNASGAVARVDLMTVAGDTARFRLGLRSPPAEAASEFGRGGLALAPAQEAGLGGAWRIGLAGGR